MYVYVHALRLTLGHNGLHTAVVQEFSLLFGAGKRRARKKQRERGETYSRQTDYIRDGMVGRPSYLAANDLNVHFLEHMIVFLQKTFNGDSFGT